MNKNMITFESAKLAKAEAENSIYIMNDEIKESVYVVLKTEDFIAGGDKTLYCNMVYDDMVESFLEYKHVNIVDDIVMYIVNYLIKHYESLEAYERCAKLIKITKE